MSRSGGDLLIALDRIENMWTDLLEAERTEADKRGSYTYSDFIANYDGKIHELQKAFDKYKKAHKK